MTALLDVVTYVHERHEDLARFREPLERAGFRPVERLRSPGPRRPTRAPQLLVVLGGPMGVYDAEAFPFLQVASSSVLRARLAADRPCIGLCLGPSCSRRPPDRAVFRGARG
jgi:GMP synthase (glutamine-hydrolysing)